MRILKLRISVGGSERNWEKGVGANSENGLEKKCFPKQAGEHEILLHFPNISFLGREGRTALQVSPV